MHSQMASFGIPCPKISPPLPVASRSIQKPMALAAFPVSDLKPNPALMLMAPHCQGCSRGQSDAFRVCAQQLPEASGEKISNASPMLEAALQLNSEKQQVPVSATPLSDFLAQVTDLVKLVDSKDIVELELKQQDCEVVIKKKEALPQPSVALPVHFAPPSAHHVISAPPPTMANESFSASKPTQPSPPKPAAPVKPKSSHPPFKSPMAGNFYRSSAPSSPPFVKVGDKVQKGQVLCIIEAMKLMNEIEADQSGSVVEILVEDGKPVGVETPLFVIEP